VALRPSQDVAPDQAIEVIGTRPFVSRGGIKLSNALERLNLDVTGLDCLDVGASTGGFTDCLLQHGASAVTSLDVAYGQIDQSMRDDPRVTVIERLNARELLPADLDRSPGLAVIDVSFISLTKVIEPVVAALAPEGELLAMVKPQFELGRQRVGRGGVVRDPADRREAVVSVADWCRSIGLTLLGVSPTGLPGPKGNLETFLHLGLSGNGAADGASLCEGVDI
jgi:23S rRNA (cytidine1920-2'-O)/16S rRNA (cytidine1409-2'-O)-methyltransferase